MAFVEWDQKYSVKVAEIDAQHRNLFELINDYYEGVQEHRTMEAIGKVIESLAQYARHHFSYEEKLMQKYGYTGTPQQMASHKAFTEKVADFQKRHQEGRLLAPVEVSNFMKRWLTEHILQSDMQYVDCFKKAGVI